MKRCGGAEVPLAHQARRVARITQAIGDSLLAQRQADAGHNIFRADGIELKSEPCLVAPRYQRRSRSCTKRRGDIPAREACSTRRHRIDLRRWNLLPAVTTEFAIAEVVDDDVNDVRFRRRISGMECNTRN